MRASVNKGAQGIKKFAVLLEVGGGLCPFELALGRGFCAEQHRGFGKLQAWIGVVGVAIDDTFKCLKGVLQVASRGEDGAFQGFGEPVFGRELSGLFAGLKGVVPFAVIEEEVSAFEVS